LKGIVEHPDGEFHFEMGRALAERLGYAAGALDMVPPDAIRSFAGVGHYFEVARILKGGGRLALADIVTDVPLPEGISCDATLWAACIGGAMQVDVYVASIEAAGLRVLQRRVNPEYRFLSNNATNASRKYGVKSISLLATKA
jgi:hypothetical protein